MMLGFKDRFLPMIEDGSKTHTIRAGARWKAGMRADLYARPRQKGMRLLFRATVTRVQTIDIREMPEELHIQVAIDGSLLTPSEAEAFFWRDGFRFEAMPSTEQAYGFWLGAMPFRGQLIHWDYTRRWGLREVRDSR